jgi:hypothetical protein
MDQVRKIQTLPKTAQILGLSPHFLRTHAERLGGVRLSPRGRWMFVPSDVLARLFGNGVHGEQGSTSDESTGDRPDFQSFLLDFFNSSEEGNHEPKYGKS